MRKTFPLVLEGKHADRVLEAIKHDIRKYLKRERRKPLPEGVDFLDFDCRVGANEATARLSHVGNLMADIDQTVQEGATSVYVELLGKPGVRQARVGGATALDAED